ncbi:PP2C family protein-serine/threonine phosphatase [Engelhardtia mirabilis]|uniref:Phosphoserine phosphatase RsbU n=1 Tax=Engelhardtia mirabilis TaxID=2528011 RepID=A0A518BJY3_9BACT|nr:Phosphoserine phosphatase RsbU [Planctomycetes bacterium Pla133]QDV01612.1 Phosphoserine phosphatase RsbU [Planctomycetes bacterium Pla86]
MFFRRKKTVPLEGADGDSKGRGAASEPAVSADSATTQFLTGDQEADRRSVQVLLEAIARVSEARDVDALLLEMVDRSIEVTGAERGILILEHEGELLARVARAKDGIDLDQDVRFSTSIAKRVLDEVQALKATVQSDSEALELGKSVFDLKLRAVMCVPLAPPPSADGRFRPRPKGVLYVDSRAATRQFKQRDLALFAALAQQITIAMANAELHLDSLEKVRLEQSLELASAIQSDLMPAVPTWDGGFDVHGWYRPAERAAGDFYDFVKARGGALAAVVGDVTGHGIGPALITASAQSGLKSYLRVIDDLGEVLTMLNQDLSERIDDGRFLTLFVGLLSPDGTVQVVNAGHQPPLLWRAGAERCIELGRHGPAIGMIDDEQYKVGEVITMESGDALLAYTDGATEVRDASRPDGYLGREGLGELFVECMVAGRDAQSTVLHLAERTLEMNGGGNDDDVTLLVVRRL